MVKFHFFILELLFFSIPSFENDFNKYIILKQEIEITNRDCYGIHIQLGSPFHFRC